MNEIKAGGSAWSCPKCGEKNNLSENFCRKCGTENASEQVLTQKSQES